MRRSGTAHRALAEALSGHGDPDREAWHRASAAEGPDQEVVDALEDRGRPGTATRRIRRRTSGVRTRRGALTTTVRRRAELTFAAARSAWACGQAGQAQALLSAARDGASDPMLLVRHRAPAWTHRGQPRVGAEAHRIFVEAAQEVYSFDPARALEIGVAAAVMRTFGADSGTPLPVDRRPGRRDRRDDPPRTRCLRHLLVAMTKVAEGDWAAAVEALDLALEVGEEVDDRDVLWNLANAALQLGADQAQQHFYGYALSRAREAGAVTAIVYCLQRLCFGHYLAGDLVAVRNSAEEALALARASASRR